MSSVYEATMRIILGRLQALPSFCDNVRRSHKVTVTRDESPAVYLAEAEDVPVGNSKSSCDQARRFDPPVRILVRDDDGYATMDALVLEAAARLDPDAPGQTPYPVGVIVELDRVSVDEETADADALRKDIRLSVTYTVPTWKLSAA